MAKQVGTRNALTGAPAWAGRLLLAFFALGLIAGVKRSIAADYASCGMWTLAGSTVLAEVGHYMAWGLLAGLNLFIAFLALLIPPTRRTRMVGVCLFAGVYALAVFLFYKAVTCFLGERLPESYVGIGQGMLFGSTIWPALDQAVARFGWLVWTLFTGLNLLALLLSVVPVSLGAKLAGAKRSVSVKAGSRLASLWPGPAALAGWALVFGLAVLLKPAAPADCPSVLLVSIDTLRFDHVGCYGYGESTTPQIDRLAEESVVFAQATSLSPYTLPSHVSMLTGLNPLVHKVTTLDNRMPERTMLLGEILGAAGYDTGAAVSNFLVGPTFGFKQGFGVYDFYPDRNAEQATGAAKRFFADRTESDRPAFFFLHLMDPHYPYKTAEQDRSLFSGADAIGFDQSLPFFEFRDRYRDAAPEDRAPLLAAYDAEIHYADRILGELLDQLREQGLYDEMLIVVTSDHGEEFWEHGGLGHTVTLYDEVLHVPLIVKLPRGSHGGELLEGQVRLTDMTAFIAARAGLSLPEGAEGRDFMEIIAEGGVKDSGPALAMTDLFGPARYSRRTSDVKWISESRFKLGSREDVFAERIYDLQTDPGEVQNLAPLDRELTDAISTLARQEITAVGSLADGRGPDQAPDLDPQMLQRLKALGYLQ